MTVSVSVSVGFDVTALAFEFEPLSRYLLLLLFPFPFSLSLSLSFPLSLSLSLCTCLSVRFAFGWVRWSNAVGTRGTSGEGLVVNVNGEEGEGGGRIGLQVATEGNVCAEIFGIPIYPSTAHRATEEECSICSTAHTRVE